MKLGCWEKLREDNYYVSEIGLSIHILGRNVGQS